MPLVGVGLGLSFLDPDEGLYGDVAREMVAHGDWVIPHFNGFPYLEKPPLYFWLTAATFRLTGLAEWVLRGWSGAAALGSIVLAWRMGRRLHGPTGGLVAGISLATSAGYALYVRKASTDLLFVFCLALAVYGFLADSERPERGARRFWLFYLGAGLGVLAKGLIGIVLPGLIVAISLLCVRGLRVRDLNLGRGAALFGAVALPWHVLAAWREPSLFWFYLVDNQLLRFLNVRGAVEDDVPISSLGFLVVTFLWFFPWGVFLLARPAPGSEGARWRPVMIVWVAVVIGFFAFSRSKLEYYALPAFPALAVLVAGAWTGGRDIGRWLAVGLAGCAAVGGAALWLGARLTPEQTLGGLAELNVYYRILREQGADFPFDSVRPFGLLLQGLGAVLLVGWALAAVCWARGWHRSAFVAVAGVGGAIAVLVVQLLAVIEPHHSAKAVAGAIVASARPDDLVVHEGALEYSAALPFYTGRRIAVVNGARGDLEFASRLPGAERYFLDGARLARLWEGPGRVFLVTQQPLRRSVAGSLPVGSIHLVGRFGSRWLYANADREPPAVRGRGPGGGS